MSPTPATQDSAPRYLFILEQTEGWRYEYALLERSRKGRPWFSVLDKGVTSDMNHLLDLERGSHPKRVLVSAIRGGFLHGIAPRNGWSLQSPVAPFPYVEFVVASVFSPASVAS